MGLSLLAPIFLLGATALAVPIIVHLSQRTKKEAVPFPSLMFLSRVPYREVRKQRIRHWLVFLLRVGALVLLVLAFARPLLDRSPVGGTGLADARELVVLLDRSFSMAHGDSWDRAVRAAKDAVAGLGPSDRATLIVFSDRAETLQPPGREATALEAALDRVELSHGATRYGPAIEVAGQVLRESRLPQRDALMISDFQRSGWDEEMDLKLPPGTQLTRINVGTDGWSNVAVSDVTFDRSYRDGRERVTVLARIANLGPEAMSGVPTVLEIDGVQTATQTVDLPAADAVTVRFPAVAVPDRELRGIVSVGDDDLPLDNEHRFVLSPGQALSVLVLHGPGAGPDGSLYVERALRIGSEPPHRVEVKSVAAFNVSDLEGRSVMVLNDAPFPGGARGRSLAEFVSHGGGLLIASGQRSGVDTWRNGLGDLAPRGGATPVDRLNDRGGTLSITDYNHPVFEVFSAPRSGDFSQTRFFRYRRMDETDGAAVIARFDDGAIALADIALGEGRVLLWTSDLTNAWNDFPVQPVFLPFMHQMVRYLAAYEPLRPSYTVGQVLDLAALIDVQESEIVVNAPAGERRVESTAPGESLTALEERGFYEYRSLGSGDLLFTAAVNVDPVESDLTPLDGEEFASALATSGEDPSASSLVATLTPLERERRQRLWWYLLIGGLFILVAESAVSNRVGRKSR
jgi:uncharacterized membrane protein